MRGGVFAGRPAAADERRAAAAAARTARATRSLTAGVAGALLLPGATACYTYRAAPESVPAGTRVELTINDRGRVGLADSLGAGVMRVQGTLAERTDSTYVLQVSHVGTLNGRLARWSGESVALRNEYVGRVARRELSRGRTAAVVAVGAAAVAFLITRALSGIIGDPDQTRVPPEPNPT